MAWEKRGNGYYYYRKRREGGHVVSEYVGAGKFAELVATLDASDRMDREARQEAWRHEREAEMAISDQVVQVEKLIRALAVAALVTSGHHTHKGQWRRKRGRQ